jgi:hypothetical protein
MPKSRNRSSRTAMRSKYRKPKRRRGGSMGWNVAISMVVVVGILLIVLVVQDRSSSISNAHPLAANQAAGVAGDHWHTYLGVNICGEWLNPAPAFEKAFDSQSAAANAGIHSHGDGLIHTHPFVAAEQGTNATLGHFLGYGGWTMTDSTIDISGGYTWAGPTPDPNHRTWNNGDTCTFGNDKGKKGEVVWSVDGKIQKGNPSDYKLQDGATIAIGFLPKGAELGFPPQACDAFSNITDQNSAAILTKNSPCQAVATTPTTTTTAPAASP